MGEKGASSGFKFSWLSFLVGLAFAFTFEEIFIRSGSHPVSVTLDANTLDVVAREPELELLLEVEQLRNESNMQQEAIRDTKVRMDKLQNDYNNLDNDFQYSMQIAKMDFYDNDSYCEMVHKSISKVKRECALNIRLAREKSCPCDTYRCPVLYQGNNCNRAVTEVPECLNRWQVPWDRLKELPITLNRESFENLELRNNKKLKFHLFFGNHPITGTVMRLPVNENTVQYFLEHEILNTTDHFRTCALVGSSPDLLQENLGPLIDNHDMVVRFNGAVTKGFENHVGSKTDLRLINWRWMGFREDPAETLLHFDKAAAEPTSGCVLKADCRNSAQTMTNYVNMLKLKEKLNIHTMHPEVMAWLRTNYTSQGFTPTTSTGFQAMLLLSHVCEKVDLYGFTGRGVVKYFNEDKIAREHNEQLSKIKLEMDEHLTPHSVEYASGNPGSRKLLSAEEWSVLDARDVMVDYDEPEGFFAVEDDRQLQKRKKRRPPPPPRWYESGAKTEYLASGESLLLNYERGCQQDLARRGLVTLYDVHAFDLSFLTKDTHKLQHTLEQALSLDEEP